MDTMIKPFAPDEYKDEYQERLRELIATKIAGKEVVSPAVGEQPQGGNIIDLKGEQCSPFQKTIP